VPSFDSVVKKKNIAILTLGTRGDVQPYAVLGQALKARGHQVTLSTAKNFEQLVLSHGIDFLPVDADFQALLGSEEGKKMMKANPLAIRRQLNTWVYPLIRESLTQFYNLAKDCDIVIYHVKTLADCFADQFPHKMIRASLLPIVEPTNEFANPAFSGLPIPAFFNRLTYTLSNLSMKMLSKPIGAFREQFNLPKKYSIPTVKNIYALSPSFFPIPHDYPIESKFTGFWFGESETALPDDLMEWISAGEPPLLLTFGSMPFKSKFDLQAAILKLTEQLDTRIIVVRGWGLDRTEKLDQHPMIKVIDAARYDKLFTLTRAIIHHGGIGTTAECLRAGKPFLICPILYPIGDQQFWGEHAYKKGLAVRPIPISKMTEKKFLERVKELLENESLYERSKEMKVEVDGERGLENAVEEVEKVGENY